MLLCLSSCTTRSCNVGPNIDRISCGLLSTGGGTPCMCKEVGVLLPQSDIGANVTMMGLNLEFVEKG